MPPLLIATHNPHKTAEFRQMLGDRFEIVDMSVLPGVPPAEETGSTFEENACLKALHASAHWDGPVLADDSGLEVDALGGAPGLYSARYAGLDATDAENRAKLIHEMRRHPEHRCARFKCMLSLARDRRVTRCFSGTIEGRILSFPVGIGGFGYDSLFVAEGETLTFAEISPDRKRRLSHRGRAADAMIEWLDSQFT